MTQSVSSFFLRHGIWLALLIWIATAPLAAAQAPLFDTPVYDPDAKRYFALMHPTRPITAGPDWEGVSWEQAYVEAQSHVFKGVHGRLAIVDSFQVHQFLLLTFRPNDATWIGMRYLCTSRQLELSDGQLFKKGEFEAWDPAGWNQGENICGSYTGAIILKGEHFAPVAYTGIPSFRWVAKGRGKLFHLYFIEFPTGHP